MKLISSLYYLVFGAILWIPAGAAFGQKYTCENRTYSENIKTVEMYRTGWRLSAPVQNIRDTSSLVLEFDDLTGETPNYTYTLIHCTADWKPSDILNNQYISGLTENQIRDYRYSRNTLQPFTHYRLSLPNEDVQIKLPGNYILYVYKDYDQDQPVLTRRFYIVDPQVHITPDVHRTDDVRYLTTTQQVDFNVTYESLEPDDPRRNFKVSIFQNLNWQASITNLLPRFIQPGELDYNYDEGNQFDGGSEFLHFDTKSIKYNTDRVADIRFERPLRHVYLMPDKPRARNSYEFQEDIDGKYLVKWDDAFDSDTEADYVMVHFQLNTGDSIEGRDVFLFGALTDWQTVPTNRCNWNPDTRCYEINLLLKQGYYNYQYVTRDRATGKINLTEIGGNYFETENDYYIFVYYRDIRERFDRLVGMEMANSVKLPKSGK